MDDLGFNKIAAAGLATVLAFIGVRTLAEVVVPEHKFEATYVPDVVLETEGAEEEVDLPFPQPSFIAALDVERGEKVFKKCLSCHNAEKGGANGTGPNLYGVMGKEMASHPGFKYSSALVGRSAVWTWEEMNGFLTKPQTWIPGTAMNYVGLKKEEDRAAVMAYLNAQTDNPIPVPEPVLVAEVVDGAVAPDAAAQPDSEETRIIDDPKVEGLPGDGELSAEAVLTSEGDDGEVLADPREQELLDGVNSAGEVDADDPSLLDPAVRAAIPGAEPNVEVEDLPDNDSEAMPEQDVVDGPMTAEDVLRTIGG